MAIALPMSWVKSFGHLDGPKESSEVNLFVWGSSVLTHLTPCLFLFFFLLVPSLSLYKHTEREIPIYSEKNSKY